MTAIAKPGWCVEVTTDCRDPETCSTEPRAYWSIHAGSVATLCNEIHNGFGPQSQAFACLAKYTSEAPTYQGLRRSTEFWTAGGYTLGASKGWAQLEHAVEREQADKAYAETQKWHTWQLAND